MFDEAHGLEDIMSDTVGIEIAPGRFVSLGASVRSISSTWGEPKKEKLSAVAPS